MQQCREDGIEFVEYADGHGCCVGPGHRNGPEANGLIVALDEVVWTSHPRCRRSCLPAPEGQPLTGGDRDPGPGLDPEPATAPSATKRDRIAQRRGKPRAPRGALAIDADSVDAAINGLVERAALLAPAIKADVLAAADGLGKIVGIENMLKGRQRIAEKVAELMSTRGVSAAAAADTINDAIRLTVQLAEGDYVANHRRLLREIADRGYRLIDHRNFWSKPSGYRGINLTLVSPEGQLFEVQIHTEASAVAKEGTHSLYEEQRLLERFSSRWVELQAQQDETFATVPIPPGAGSLAG